MKEKIILFLLSIIPIGYFIVKYFIDHNQHYLYFILIIGIINLLIFITLKNKVTIQYWLGLLFSCMFFEIIFAEINFDHFLASWSNLNYFLLIPAMGLVILSSVIQTSRWKIILENLNHFGFKQLFPSVLIGHASNHIFPAKAGELIKCYHLGKKYNYSKVSIFSTVIVERVFDGIMVLSFLLVFILAINTNRSELMVMGGFGALLYGGVLAFLFVTVFYYDKLLKLLAFFLPTGILGFVTKHLTSFAEGLHVLKNGKHFINVIFFSIVMWFVTVLSILPVAWMFEFQLPIYASFAILACVALGLSVPAAPGGLGIVSVAAIFSLKILFAEVGQPISDELYAKMVSYSILINVVLVLPEIVLGMFFIFREGFSLFNLNKESSNESSNTGMA